MRDYAKIAPTFWTRGSGKKLRSDKDGRILATYVMSAPMSNMIGLYYLPESTIVHDTGLTHVEVTAALHRLAVLGIAFYDTEQEMIWAPNMAKYQVGEEIKVKAGKPDNRIVPLRKEVDAVGRHPFLWDFFQRYAKPYNLTPPPFLEGLHGPFEQLVEALTEPLPDQEKGLLGGLAKGLPRAPGLQEQEQEQSRSSRRVREDAPSDAAAAAGQDPDWAAIRKALEHPSFITIDRDAVATDRVEWFRSLQITKPGFQIDWFVAAIRDAAGDCTGTGLTPQAIVSTVRRYTHSPRPPRAPASGAIPVAESEVDRLNRLETEARRARSGAA